MPLQLAQLFSATLHVSVTIPPEMTGGVEESIDVEWAPARYTGEMDELASEIAEMESDGKAEVQELEDAGQKEAAFALVATINRRIVRSTRRLLSQIVVGWDLMDGKKPHPTDLEGLLKLPDAFVMLVFQGISEGNQVDPPKAPGSSDTSVPGASSARSRRGTSSSKRPTTSASRRGR